MPNELVSLRLSEDVIERLDQHAANLKEYTGVEISRADVIRKFLIEGLDRWEAKKPPRRK